jgi:hypothetical protein
MTGGTLTIEEFAIMAGSAAVGVWLIRYSWASAQPSPDPWDDDVAKSLLDPKLPELCHRCLTPHGAASWFCPTCGGSVGTYNNYMPYLYIFSQGEVLRSGVNDRIRRSPLIIGGYLIYSLANYAVFAPIYWYFLFHNLKRQTPNCAQDSEQAT